MTDMRQEPRLRYILVARSGCGKTTMAGFLQSELGLRRCVTSTTRPPRAGEVDGRDYHFLKAMEPTRMFECAQFGSHWYGTSWDELNQSDFIILDPQGVAYYRANFPAPLTVIQLERSCIDVDPERQARDRFAGFDRVNPDIVIRGETIPEMSRALLCAVRTLEAGRRPPLDRQITDAGTKNKPTYRYIHMHDLSL